jgi:hypothetical protein
MDALSAFFGFACVLTVLFAVAVMHKDGGERVLMALVLVISWAVCNLLWQASTQSQVLRANGLIDALTLNFLMASFPPKRLWSHGWVCALAFVVVLQVLIDIYREVTPTAPFTPWQVVLNATFAAQLAIVACGGFLDVLRRCCVRWNLPLSICRTQGA